MTDSWLCLFQEPESSVLPPSPVCPSNEHWRIREEKKKSLQGGVADIQHSLQREPVSWENSGMWSLSSRDSKQACDSCSITHQLKLLGSATDTSYGSSLSCGFGFFFITFYFFSVCPKSFFFCYLFVWLQYISNSRTDQPLIELLLNVLVYKCNTFMGGKKTLLSGIMYVREIHISLPLQRSYSQILKWY